jgi:hypothetical protein
MSRTRKQGPRHAAERRAAEQRASEHGAADHARSEVRRSPRRPVRRPGAHAAGRQAAGTRSLLAAAGLLAVGTVVVLTGTGSTFALWSTTQTVTGPTIVSGDTGLTINGETDYVLPGLRLAALAPGQSLIAPLTLRNTGSTPLGVRVAGTDITGESNGLAASLAASVTQAASCAPGLPGARSAPLAGFATPPLASLPAGSDLSVCLEVRLDPAAPATVQGGSAGFTMTFEATQEPRS